MRIADADARTRCTIPFILFAQPTCKNHQHLVAAPPREPLRRRHHIEEPRRAPNSPSSAVTGGRGRAPSEPLASSLVTAQCRAISQSAAAHGKRADMWRHLIGHVHLS
ncbi:hypothetical protein V8G54_012343 [Vigna mungo]|uniref:Uncharacterized protein n=1 Tax=Vigna mungo TaxID=3915 RepID=A0AAQ3S276_VIGMU